MCIKLRVPQDKDKLLGIGSRTGARSLEPMATGTHLGMGLKARMQEADVHVSIVFVSGYWGYGKNPFRGCPRTRAPCSAYVRVVIPTKV